MKTMYKNLSITINYISTGFNNSWNLTTNNYKVVIKNMDTKKYTTFNYYTGIGIKIYDFSWIDTFYCILSDCIAVIDNTNCFDFLENFGYSYNKESLKIYNNCKNSLRKMKRILNGVDVYTFYNDFMDLYHDEI